MSVLEKLSIGDLNDLDSSSTVFSSSSSFSEVSSEPFVAGLFGSKKPAGFLNDAIISIFKIASSAINNPAVRPALGSSDKPTAILFILSISTP